MLMSIWEWFDKIDDPFLKVLVVVTSLSTAIVAVWRAYKLVKKPLCKFISSMLGLTELREEIKATNAKIDKILYEMSPNSGSSLKDTINRVESRQRALLDINESEVGIFETDTKGMCVWVNRKYCRIAGRSLDEMLGTGWLNTIHHTDKIRIHMEWMTSIAETRESQFEYELITSDDEVIHVTCKSRKMCDNAGKVIGFIGTVTPTH